MKTLTFFIALIITAIGISAFTFIGNEDHLSVLYSGGPPPGYSGDPKSEMRNCTSCHTGAEVKTQIGWITSNIPPEGYLPNSTYTITATAKGEGITKFGFQISPQNMAGDFMGTLVSTQAETKLTSDPNYITHTSSGTAGSDSLSWIFDWTAPAEGSGDLSFYGAFNLTNGNGRTDGDVIMVSTLSIKELIASVPEVSDDGQKLSVYPNPARAFITIDVDYSLLGSSYHIFDQGGREVMRGTVNTESTTVDINHIVNGIYYIQVGTETRTSIKIVKN